MVWIRTGSRLFALLAGFCSIGTMNGTLFTLPAGSVSSRSIWISPMPGGSANGSCGSSSIDGRWCNTNWWLVHGVYLPDDHGLLGTIVHNPRSNMNNGVDYAQPRRFVNPIGLGTDGIGADMLDEFRVAFVAARAADVTTDPDQVWSWFEPGWNLMPGARSDIVSWDYQPMDAWRLAYSPGVSPIEVSVDGQTVWQNGASTRVDGDEVRAKAAEAAERLFARLGSID